MEINQHIPQMKNRVLQEIIKEIEEEKKKRVAHPHWGNWMNWANWLDWNNWGNWFNWWT